MCTLNSEGTMGRNIIQRAILPIGWTFRGHRFNPIQIICGYFTACSLITDVMIPSFSGPRPVMLDHKQMAAIATPGFRLVRSDAWNPNWHFVSYLPFVFLCKQIVWFGCEFLLESSVVQAILSSTSLVRSENDNILVSLCVEHTRGVSNMNRTIKQQHGLYTICLAYPLFLLTKCSHKMNKHSTVYIQDEVGAPVS